jgi:transcriptional regulator with XRE-family HTH domain
MDQSKKRVKIPIEPEDQLVKLGARIKALRIKAGYASYETFAYEHGLPRAQYGRYEQGKDLRFSSLVKVVGALGFTLDEFFKDGFVS